MCYIADRNTLIQMPPSVMEVGGVDDAQLAVFQDLGLDVLAVAPSEQLQATKHQNGNHGLKFHFDWVGMTSNHTFVLPQSQIEQYLVANK